MRIVVLAVLLVAAASPVFSGDAKPKEYPLTLTVLSSDRSTSPYTSNQSMDTTCTTDGFGRTNCSTSGGTTQGTAVHLTQTAEGSDGNIYTIEWSSRRQDFGAGMASSSGAVRYGTTLLPGEYKARFDNHGLKLLIANKKGELKEHSFIVLSARKKEVKPLTN